MTPLALVPLARPSTGVLPFSAKRSRTLEVSNSRYLARLAISKEEIEAALRVRFAVFNLELGEGLASSFTNGKDWDHFDDHFEHLILIDKTSSLVIGTCRIQTYERAQHYSGYSSSERFNLADLPPEVLQNSIEVGRACVLSSHRSKQSFNLAWQFLLKHARQNHKKYLLRCCSLKSQDPLSAGRVFGHLSLAGHIHPQFQVSPRPEAKCLFYKTLPGASKKILPSSIQSFIRRGAKFCGMPAIDRDFRTIDFLGLLDLESANY